MDGSRFHGNDRSAAVLDELLHDSLGIVVFTVGETGKTSYGNNVAVAAHHRNGFQQMFAFVTIHDDASFCFQLPCSGIDIKYDDIHAQVHGCLLCAQTCPQRVVEKYHQQGLVLSQMLIVKSMFLYFKCLCNSCIEVSKIFYIEKCLHERIVY